MNITYIVNVFPKLSETFVLDQITYLIDQGHRVNIIASKEPHETEIHADIDKYDLRSKTIYLQPSDYPPRFEITGELIQTILFSDIIHAHFATWPAETAMKIAKLTGIPFIFTAHAYDIFIDPDIGRLVRMAESASKILTVTEYNKKHIVNLIGEAYRDKIEIIRCAVNTKKLQPLAERSNEKIVILSCGRFVEKKGMTYALKAFAKLPDKPNIELRIIGDGPLEEEIKAEIKELGISDNVRLLGPLPHAAVFNQLKNADIFLLPSVTADNGDCEGLPVSILEAQALGIPVVSSLHTGIPEGVINGETGFLVAERDVKTLAERLQTLVQSPELRKQMGVNGRTFILKGFNSSTELHKLDSIVHELTSKNFYWGHLTAKDKDNLSHRLHGLLSTLNTQKENVLSDKTKEIAHYIEQIRQKDKHLANNQKQLEDKNRQLEDKSRQLEDKNKQRLTQIAEKDTLIRLLKQQSIRLQHSLSWRLTAPLRKIDQLFKKTTNKNILPTQRPLPILNPKKSPIFKDRQQEKKIKKVLYVLNNFPKLSETFVLNEIVELIERGTDVYIIALRNPKEKTINKDVKKYDLLSKTLYVHMREPSISIDKDTICALYKDVDIVHSHFVAEGAELGTQVAQMLECPFTVTAHAYEIFRDGFIFPDKIKKTFARACKIITPSLYNRDYLVQTFHQDKNKIEIVHATIEKEKFKAKGAEQFKENQNALTLITVGRLVEKKGIAYLLQAMTDIVKHYPTIKLLIVGSGPLEEEFTEFVRQSHLEGNVIFKGDQSNDDCVHLIEESDIAILPCIVANDGDRDVCPLTLQEAMAMSIPVISTDAASITELIDHGISGIIVPEKDVDSLSKAILELIQDEDKRAALGKHGRKIIEDEFNIETQGDKLLDIWRKMVL